MTIKNNKLRQEFERPARQAVGESRVRVRVLEGDAAPKLCGHSSGYETKGGREIRYPSAYSKVGWSNMVYRSSTLRIEVGRGWLIAQASEALMAKILAERLIPTP
jgi:hypothetical protein